MQALHPERRNLRAKLRFFEPCGRNSVAIGLRHRRARDHCQKLQQWDRRPGVRPPDPLDVRSSHRWKLAFLTWNRSRGYVPLLTPPHRAAPAAPATKPAQRQSYSGSWTSLWPPRTLRELHGKEVTRSSSSSCATQLWSPSGRPRMMPRRTRSSSPATPSSSTCLAASCNRILVDHLLVRNVVKSLEKVVEHGTHCVPVCCGPLAPRRRFSDAALHAARVWRKSRLRGRLPHKLASIL